MKNHQQHPLQQQNASLFITIPIQNSPYYYFNSINQGQFCNPQTIPTVYYPLIVYNPIQGPLPIQKSSKTKTNNIIGKIQEKVLKQQSQQKPRSPSEHIQAPKQQIHQPKQQPNQKTQSPKLQNEQRQQHNYLLTNPTIEKRYVKEFFTDKIWISRKSRSNVVINPVKIEDQKEKDLELEKLLKEKGCYYLIPTAYDFSFTDQENVKLYLVTYNTKITKTLVQEFNRDKNDSVFIDKILEENKVERSEFYSLLFEMDDEEFETPLLSFRKLLKQEMHGKCQLVELKKILQKFK